MTAAWWTAHLHKWLSWLRHEAARLGSAYCVYDCDELWAGMDRGSTGHRKHTGRADKE